LSGEVDIRFSMKIDEIEFYQLHFDQTLHCVFGHLLKGIFWKSAYSAFKVFSSTGFEEMVKRAIPT
jgi:hypothetical protein